VCVVAREEGVVSEISDQKRSIVEEARRAAISLVEREERRCGSRMVAYFVVGQMVGASEIWVRRFVNKHPSAKPDLIVGWNILQRYERDQKQQE
jgi:hypothetical protein